MSPTFSSVEGSESLMVSLPPMVNTVRMEQLQEKNSKDNNSLGESSKHLRPSSSSSSYPLPSPLLFSLCLQRAQDFYFCSHISVNDLTPTYTGCPLFHLNIHAHLNPHIHLNTHTHLNTHNHLDDHGHLSVHVCLAAMPTSALGFPWIF